jgi:hypothetical protein
VAVTKMEKLLQMQKMSFGETHEKTIATEEGIKTFRHLLRIERASSYKKAAQSGLDLLRDGRNDEAYSAFKGVYEGMKKSHGEDHFETNEQMIYMGVALTRNTQKSNKCKASNYLRLSWSPVLERCPTTTNR